MSLSKKSYTLIFVVVVLLGKALAFVRDVVISSYFGADYTTDAYFVANSIPSLIFVGFFSTVSLVFLPHYNKIKKRKGISEASDFASNVLNTYALVSFVISAVGVVFAKELVSIVAPSFNEQTFNLCVELTRILCLSFIFSISSGILSTIQNVDKSYLGPQLIPVVNSALIILAIVFLTDQYGIKIIAYSSIIAWVVQVPLQYALSRRMFNYRLVLRVSDDTMKKMGLMIIPAFIGISIDQLNFLIDNNLGSRLEAGSISALNYSTRLINFFSGLFVIVIANIIYPKISDKVVENDVNELNQLLNSALRVFMLIAIPMTIFCCLMRIQIVELVFARGAFDEVATSVTSEVFMLYSLGILFILIRELNNKLFYAKLDSKTPLFISIAAIMVNVVLSLTLIESMGVSGLALATTISIVFYVIVQIIVLLRLIGSEFLERMFPFTLKLSFAGLGMYASAYCLLNFIMAEFSAFLSVLAVGVISVTVFFVIAKLCRIKEVDIALEGAKSFIVSFTERK